MTTKQTTELEKVVEEFESSISETGIQISDIHIEDEDGNLLEYNGLEFIVRYFKQTLASYAEQQVRAERKKILTKAREILDEEAELYGTDKHGLSYEQLLELIK